MTRYDVYATRWDDPHIIEELIPATGLEFSMPRSDHGEASFSATVEPGRSLWRPAITPLLSGIQIARDDTNTTTYWVVGESQTGPRTFSYQCVEWGAFLERILAVAHTYPPSWDDHDIIRDIITRAAAVPGQDCRLTLPDSHGTARSGRTINAWDDKTVGGELVSMGEAQGGPEWYIGAGGTLADPKRVLVMADRLGDVVPQVVLEYVEDTQEPDPLREVPSVVLLGDLFPGGNPVVPLPGRRGGNVLAVTRTRTTGSSATVARATGSGDESARLVKDSPADDLLGAGFPRLTSVHSYSDVSDPSTLQRRADADLAASRGLATGWSVVTLDGAPDWTQVPRGSSVRLLLDTDVYGGSRPVDVTARLDKMTVRVADDGPAQIQWDLADVIGA